jgi:hypothetical protein
MILLDILVIELEAFDMWQHIMMTNIPSTGDIKLA